MRGRAASKPSRPASALRGPAQQVEHAAVAADELGGQQPALPVGAGIGQALLLEAQGLLLPGVVQLGHGDLLHLVAQHVGLAGALLVVAAQRGQGLVERPQPAAQGAAPGSRSVPANASSTSRWAAGVTRVRCSCCPWISTSSRRRLAQGAHRGHAPVDPGPRAALGRDGAGQDDLASASAASPPTASGVGHETRLDQGLRRAGPHHPHVGPAPEDELERLDHQRLAGARLAGQRRHARAERECEVLDHAEIPDAQLAQHVGHGRGRSASRRKRRMLPKVCGSLRTTRTGLAATRQVMTETGLEPAHVGPVDHQRPGPVGHHLDAHLLVLAEDQAAVEREVRGHRRHHHGAQGGGQDGPPAERL